MKTFVFWLLVIFAVFLYVIPAIRLLFKRISCARKLRRLCRRRGFTLQGTHALWFLGSRRRKGCDFVLGTPSQVFAVKLFGMLRSARVLVFRETGEYFFRRYSSILLFIFDIFDGAFRRLPEYDFSRGEEAANGRTRRDVLLLNPIPMEIRLQPHNGKEAVTGPGDTLFGMELASISHLMRIVDSAAEQAG